MTSLDTLATSALATEAVSPKTAPTLRKPFVEPALTEQGDLSEVTAGAFGDQSP